jgi:hypothetical protein
MDQVIGDGDEIAFLPPVSGGDFERKARYARKERHVLFCFAGFAFHVTYVR